MSRCTLYKVTVRSNKSGDLKRNLPLIRMLRKECTRFYNASTIPAPWVSGMYDDRYVDHLHTVHCKMEEFKNTPVSYEHTFKVKKQTLFAAQMFHDIKMSEYVTIKRVR